MCNAGKIVKDIRDLKANGNRSLANMLEAMWLGLISIPDHKFERFKAELQRAVSR